jgi:hypothetical protein
MVMEVERPATSGLVLPSGAPVNPFQRAGLGYVYEPVDADGEPRGIRMRVDYLHRRADEMSAELLVESTLPGVPSHVHQARFNLTSTSARTTMAKHLAGVAPSLTQQAWGLLLEQCCAGVLGAERQGEPFQKVGRMPARVRPPDLVEGLIQSGRPNAIYGPGGTGKGWIATAIAVGIETGTDVGGLRVQPGRVLYLDWEDDAYTLNDRVVLVANGMGITEPPEIAYRASQGALRNQVQQVARFVMEARITLVIVDSVELAIGTGDGSTSYEDKALGLFGSMRTISACTPWPVAWLLIDHVSDEARRSTSGVNKQIGSVMKGNLSRNAWEVRKDQEIGGPISYLGLYSYKVNHGPNAHPIGIALDFSDPQMVTLHREDVRGNHELSKRLPGQERIKAVLMRGPREVADIATITGLKPGEVRSYLSRYHDKLFYKLDDGRWANLGATPRPGPRSSTPTPELPSHLHLVTLDDGTEIPF